MAQQTDPTKNHTEGLLIREFCTQRKSKCSPCSNKYDDCVKNGPLAAAFQFPRLANKQTGPVTQDISQNAHHILCVAEVTKVISKDSDLRRVLDNTVYCINAAVNMIALPLFAHTVHWYCTHRRRGTSRWVGGVFSMVDEPLFVDLPNHDYDHGKYNEEVESALNTLNADIKTSDHGFDSNAIADSLNALSGDFRSRLEARGKRRGGTHESWMAALHGEDALWFVPFSLASDDDVTAIAWPGPDVRRTA